MNILDQHYEQYGENLRQQTLLLHKNNEKS